MMRARDPAVVLGTARPATIRAARTVRTWDLEADVVVVGFGCAGACAAIEAAEAGADVLRPRARQRRRRHVRHVGRADLPGRRHAGATGVRLRGLAGGDVQVPDGRLRSRSRRGQDPGLLRRERRALRLAGRARRAVQAQLLPGAGLEPPTDDCLVYSGGEDAYPFDRIATPAPRGHKPQHPARRRRLPDAEAGAPPPSAAARASRRRALRDAGGRRGGSRRRRRRVGTTGATAACARGAAWC